MKKILVMLSIVLLVSCKANTEPEIIYKDLSTPVIQNPNSIIYAVDLEGANIEIEYFNEIQSVYNIGYGNIKINDKYYIIDREIQYNVPPPPVIGNPYYAFNQEKKSLAVGIYEIWEYTKPPYGEGVWTTEPQKIKHLYTIDYKKGILKDFVNSKIYILEQR